MVPELRVLYNHVGGFGTRQGTRNKNLYLSPGERRHLDQQISDRRQGSREAMRSYATSLLTLMRRRGGLTMKRSWKLYHNIKPELRLLIRRQGGHPDPGWQVPEIGKRQVDRANTTCNLVRETHSTDPRPFIRIKFTHSCTPTLTHINSRLH